MKTVYIFNVFSSIVNATTGEKLNKCEMNKILCKTPANDKKHLQKFEAKNYIKKLRNTKPGQDFMFLVIKKHVC